MDARSLATGYSRHLSGLPNQYISEVGIGCLLRAIIQARRHMLTIERSGPAMADSSIIGDNVFSL